MDYTNKEMVLIVTLRDSFIFIDTKLRMINVQITTHTCTQNIILFQLDTDSKRQLRQRNNT
jgi:hypothetical protein